MLALVLLSSIFLGQLSLEEKKRDVQEQAQKKKWCAQAPRGMKEAIQKLSEVQDEILKISRPSLIRDGESAESINAKLNRKHTPAQLKRLEELAEEEVQALGKILALSQQDAATDSMWRTKIFAGPNPN